MYTNVCINIAASLSLSPSHHYGAFDPAQPNTYNVLCTSGTKHLSSMYVDYYYYYKDVNLQHTIIA